MKTLKTLIGIFLAILVSGSVWGQVYDSSIPNGYSKITLIAGDVWGDGTGYQMLLDDDYNTYGTTIPISGGITSDGIIDSGNWGDVDASVYNQFEYKIPVNADGLLSTSNIVFENSITIYILAGIYDWCITNPTPGDRMWIASSGGNIGGRQNDFVFENQYHYIFTISLGSDNHDRTDLNLPPKPREQCQVGDNWGENYDGYLPSYSLYDYSLTQQIYTADEIGNSDIIGKLFFYNDCDHILETPRSYRIYFTYTTKSTFENSTDWIHIDENDLVFEGEFSPQPHSWHEITLNTEFFYNGRDNLAITIDDNTGSWESTVYYSVYDASGNQSLRVYRDDEDYDPFNPTQYSGTLMSVKNQIKLCNPEGWTLPISLLSFTASPQLEYNLVQWTTATEKNNDLFILERSEDAVVFDEVYNVSGAGNSLEPLDYEFRDYCPVPDITYYRLTQVDYDGSKTTSEIVSCIRTSEKMSTWEYFTRYDNLLQVHSNDKVLTIICSDLLGRTIWQGKLLPHDDEELVLKVPYMVHIYEDGNLVGSEKMLK